MKGIEIIGHGFGHKSFTNLTIEKRSKGELPGDDLLAERAHTVKVAIAL